jgi:predicted nuclease of predicted toxin-antitoxin system
MQFVTNDKDFGELAFRSGQAYHGVLFLRLHDEKPANRIRVVRATLEQYADRLAGNFVVASEAGVRIRPALRLVKSDQAR